MKTLIFLIPIAVILFACSSSVEDVSQEPVVTADKLVSQTERLEVEITNTPTLVPTIAPMFTPPPTWTTEPTWTPVPTWTPTLLG